MTHHYTSSWISFAPDDNHLEVRRRVDRHLNDMGRQGWLMMSTQYTPPGYLWFFWLWNVPNQAPPRRDN